MKQTKVTEWIISGNPEQYNVVDAFHNLHRVDWAQKANMTAGDIVYIYVSGNVKAIKFKCRVNKADLDESDIDDREYDLSGQFDGTAGRYMELELLEEYVGDEYSREELMKHGFRSPQGPIRMPESVKQYLESISVFEHRYPVNTAVWIATALLSAESFDSNPVCSKSKVFNDASLKVDQMNLYELFINMYLQEVRQLVKRGIKSNYVGQEDNLRYYKGKLLVNQQVRANLAHKERFYVAYEEFHPNRAENRLVKATLAKLQKLTTSAENSKEIRQLLTAFEMVDASVNYAKDFLQVVINRNTKDYEMLMQWSKVFLMNKSFTTFSGATASRALLFPMESVYESYVTKQMKKVMSPEGWEVSSQDKGHYLFMEPRRQFALRPDIVMKRGERTVILDTKWKSLVDNERVNYGISQADMYQMYAYSKKYNTPEIWLLYPVNDEMRNHYPIRFESGDGTTVNLHFVDVDKIEESLQELRSLLEAGE